MAVKTFQRAHGDDIKEVVRNLQTNLEETLRILPDALIIDGRLLTDVSLPSMTLTNVNHGLGRTPRGAIPTKQSTSANIEVRDFDGQTLSLYATAAVVCDFWVF